MDKEEVNRSRRPIVIAFLIGATILFLLVFKEVAAPLTLAALIALIIHPLYLKIEKIVKKKKSLAAILTTILVCLIIIIPFSLLLFYSINEAALIYNDISNFILNLSDSNSFVLRVGGFLKKSGINLDISNLTQNFIVPLISSLNVNLAKFISSLVSNVSEFFIGLFISLISIFYFLRDGDKLIDLIIKILPFSKNENKQILDKSSLILKSVLMGNILTAIIQGIVGGIGFAIFNLPTPIFWGMIMFISALIPFVGPMFVYIPTGIIMFISNGRLDLAILFLLYNFIVTSSVDNIVKPLVISGRVKINSLIILISIIGGIKLWGALGLVYGPLVVALLLIALDFYLERTKQLSLFEEKNER